MNIRGLKNKRVLLFAAAALALLDLLLVATRSAPLVSAMLSTGLAACGLLAILRISLRRSRVIWRLRNRLIVTYVFMGAVPIILILALSYVGSWIVVGQVATHLVGAELMRRAAILEEPARVLSMAKPEERDAMVRQMGPLFRTRAPGVEILVTGSHGEKPLRCPPESKIEPLPGDWKDYTGLLYKDRRYYAMSMVHHGGTSALILAPLGREVLEQLVPGIGSLSITNAAESDERANVKKSAVTVTAGNRTVDFGPGLAGTVPPAYNALDTEFFWFNPIDAVHWQRPNEPEMTVLSVTTRASAVLNVVFADRLEAAQVSTAIFVGLAILLALVELVSAAIGISMTRAITGAVHNLYEGTQRVGKGDFSHRIPVRGKDQLADLGDSFNQMSAQLENLLVVAKEKERLQSELAIACEVQNQLFPRSAPVVSTIEILGACEPARSASGDYYDYLCLPNGNLAFAIGDVAGKGISAALLMAAIQSIMRTQLLAGQYGGLSTAGIVAQLSRQLYANTSPEKYATFFFGLYDKDSRELTYTNAGHLAPLILRDGNVTQLEVTGTVVGLFPSSTYEEQRTTLAAGDLFVAYTDGITEPENAYGVEFGEERLAESVLKNQACETVEIVARVMEAVKQWSSAPELPDDMTVLVARGLA